MKRPTTLLSRVLLNEALQTDVAVERDLLEIEDRYEHEGMSFLTITLPSLCDALDQGLAKGRITPSDFTGFKPVSKGGKLPALYSGFFIRVFGTDGSLLERPCISSIRAIRQCSRLFKKVELPCSAERLSAAYKRYISNDEELPLDLPDNNGNFTAVAGFLWSRLETLVEQIFCSPGVFGTGATQEKASYVKRHSIRRWHARAEQFFPLSYHSAHSEDLRSTFNGISILQEHEEPPVRVVSVPKTLKTPRIISVEPSYVMLCQQSVAKPLMDWLESDQFGYRFIRFTDQTVNREMARIGSIDGSLATIDLSDASDRVSLALMERVFRKVAPTFLDMVLACRSTRAKVPGFPVINLRKFASQGSATTFPIEAMVFGTIVIDSILRQKGLRPSRKQIAEITAKISVYGDDIIVPSETAAGVMEDLESYGLKVNHSKSFATGLFRESCGGDYYQGHDVTPAYCRQWDFAGSVRDSRVLSAYVSLSNQFYMKGLWNASQFIRDHVERCVGRVPRTTAPVGGISFASGIFDTLLRWDAARCGWRVKTLSNSDRRADSTREEPEDVRGAMLLAFQGRELAERRKTYRQYGEYHPAEHQVPSGPISLCTESAFGIVCECLACRGRDSSHDPALAHIHGPCSDLGGVLLRVDEGDGSVRGSRLLGSSVTIQNQHLLGELRACEAAEGGSLRLDGHGSDHSRAIGSIDLRLKAWSDYLKSESRSSRPDTTSYAVNMKRRWIPVTSTGIAFQ